MNRNMKVWLSAANAAVLLLTLVLFLNEQWNVLNRALYGYHMTNNMSHEPNERIVVIGIDDMSLEAIGRFPWDRRVYVELLHMLNQPGFEPSSISFDISFDEASDPEADAAFAEALSQYDNVVFPVVGITEQVTRHADVKDYLVAYDVRQPYELFAEHVRTAHINALIDDDSVIRRTVLQIQAPDGTLIPSLALNAAQMAGADVSKYLENDYFAGRNAKTEMYINYNAASDEFLTVPFISVVAGEIDPVVFQDAIVLIGFNAVGFENDNGATPIEREMKLVYAHANIIHQLLEGSVTNQADWYVTLGLMLLLFALTWWFAWRLKTTYSVVLFAAIVAGLFALQYAVYGQSKVYVDVVNPLVVLLLTYILNVSVKSYLENKQKNFITKQFGRYISPDLVKEIATTNLEIKLGGINKELSILFLDIRGFTTLSEKLKPEEVVDFLNEMFDLITNKALENKGTIDKFIGDAAMLIFNAPLDVDNHPYYAVKTAWDIQQGMIEVRERIEARHGVTVNCGIGVHTGEVVVGNIGSYLRVDYTCIGDNVNTAARIESQTTAGQILVSEATYERTKEYFRFNYVGDRMMKGKTVAVKLYEVLGPAT
ncbi:adenylate/guanylate cyclase domain-containing protein [Paenibacillus sp.]|uniref:adenylate/guanylate cyclase domain-containing protein n=1 Tax=Paenibacillus sp. TaxID=58172 RepID=UPI002D697282|nr:adenylate/guanylate cyclase domain-containing protein [Paenibacillus sp.]HZG88369.1 adenylate/guanylate cyclase domain-containing protein [Paenibacillus sp.]